MAEVFGREYELYVGLPTGLIEKHNEPTGFEGIIPVGIKNPKNLISSDTGGYIDYLTVPRGVKLIKNPIQMEADIKYTKGSTPGSPQSATIKVYNLSQDTLNYFEADAAVVLKAGYKQDPELPIIFVGQVLKVSSQRVRQDIVTTLVCKEVANVEKNLLFTGSYPEGLSYDFIIDDIIRRLGDNGVPLGAFIETDRTSRVLEEDFSVSGKMLKVLTDICISLDYTWFMSKGKIYIQPTDADRPTEFIEPKKDQVIGSVRPSNDKTGKSASDKESKVKGVDIDLFLNGEIGTHTYIRLGDEYGQYKGDYAPESVQHKLNWHKGVWQTKIQSQGVTQFDTNR